MQGFNLTENVGTADTLTAGAYSLMTGASAFSPMEKMADLRNAHNGSGSGIPDLIEDIRTTVLADMRTKFSDFGNAVSNYLNSDHLDGSARSISSFIDEITGELPQVSELAVINCRGMVSNTGLLSEAISSAADTLTEFKGSADFLDDIEMTFGEGITADEATDAINSLIDGSAGIKFQVKDLESLGADAAFAAATNTIYLSSTFLSENKGNPDTVANAILEEWGHYLDTALNNTDSAGDEGEIFVSLVKNFNFDIDALRADIDIATWNMDGQTVMVEKVSGSITIPNTWIAFRNFATGEVLGFKRDGTNTALTDMYYNGRTYENLRSPINLNARGNLFSIDTFISSSSDLRPDSNGVMRFVSGAIRPRLTVNAPQWVRVQ